MRVLGYCIPTSHCSHAQAEPSRALQLPTPGIPHLAVPQMGVLISPCCEHEVQVGKDLGGELRPVGSSVASSCWDRAAQWSPACQEMHGCVQSLLNCFCLWLKARA